MGVARNARAASATHDNSLADHLNAMYVRDGAHQIAIDDSNRGAVHLTLDTVWHILDVELVRAHDGCGCRGEKWSMSEVMTCIDLWCAPAPLPCSPTNRRRWPPHSRSASSCYRGGSVPSKVCAESRPMSSCSRRARQPKRRGWPRRSAAAWRPSTQRRGATCDGQHARPKAG